MMLSSFITFPVGADFGFSEVEVHIMAYVKGLIDSMLDIIATVSDFIRLAGYSEFLFSSTGRLNPLSRAISFLKGCGCVHADGAAKCTWKYCHG